MHAFSLLIGSVLGHPWSNKVVADAQKVSVHFRSSHRLLRLLQNEAEIQKLQATTPLRANATRFTSVHQCLDSLKKLEDGFKANLRDLADANGQPVSFTDLLLGNRFNFMHAVFEPGYVPQHVAAPRLPTTLGNIEPGQAPPRLDASAMFAQMSRGNL